jgi:hypothetical protein
MSKALCVKCGSRKDGAFVPCATCGLDPARHDGDRDLQTRSVLLSEPYSSASELAEAERRLKAGEPVAHDPARLASIAELLRTQRVPLLAPAKGGLLPIVWVPVLLAALVLGGVLYAFFA